MAFYNGVPEKKKKNNYGEKGSWDEEGRHYRRTRKSTEETDRGFVKKEYAPKTGRKKADDKSLQYGTRREKTAPLRRTSSAEEKHYIEYEYVDYSRRDRADSQRSDDSENILCGRNPIREALRNNRDIEKLLVQKGELNGSAKQIVQFAKEKKIMVQEVDKTRLDEIAEHHQGLIAIASAYQYSSLTSILETAEERNEDPFIILLDGITDPHNLGAIIRTAECAGAHGVVVPVHRSVGLTPAAVKASAGAIEHVKVARVTNINRTIEELQQHNIWVYALTMNGTDYEKVRFEGGTALVIGAEGEGISPLTEKKCDQSVSLPLKGKIDSLNASVAAGIIMYRVLAAKRK